MRTERSNTDPPNSGTPILPAGKSQLRCEWCGSDGNVIGESYVPTYIVKCTTCHHEWQVVLSPRELRALKAKGRA